MVGCIYLYGWSELDPRDLEYVRILTVHCPIEFDRLYISYEYILSTK